MAGMTDQQPRYIVGIDLGTTNCVVCAVELKDGSTIERVVVPQLTQVGEIGERNYLPSALLTNAASEEIGLKGRKENVPLGGARALALHSGRTGLRRRRTRAPEEY